MDRKTAILQWLNCLTMLDSVNDVSDLANGNHFLEFAKTINKMVYEPLETETEEEALERRYNYIKETINSHFHIDCGKLVNFESCKLGSDGHDLVLVILLLLSAMVNHSVYSVVDQTRLTPLHELELNTQEFIRECLESILAAEDELQLFNIISNITAFAIHGTRRSLSSSSPHVSSSSVTPVLRTRSRQGKAKNSMQSPLKVFMESPNFKQQVSMKEKKKEINNLRRRLNSEENKAIDFENRNNLLVNEMHSKEKEIKELKEKVNFLNPFRELADEYELKKAELQEQLDMFEKKQKICANCKHQENCIKTLEDELFEVKSQNEIMEERCKHFQAQLDAFHKDIVERDSIINRFTISKSEDDDKIQALGMEINRLLSCEAMYKKRYEEEHAQMKTSEPFQTPQRCEGETLKGVIDKMLEEKEAELEKERAKIKDLEEKINQLQSQQKIKDEYNEKLQRSCSELEVQLTKIEKSEKELNSELSHVTAQYDSCVHQIEILENTFAALKLEFLTKEKEFQKSISFLSEKNQQQKIELDHSEKDYKKLLTEKEASEKELQLELEQQQNVFNGMQTKIIEYVGKITVLTQDHENMQEEINAKKEELVTLQREKSHFETELERSITAQERLRNQHEVACTQFVQARNTDQAGGRGLIDCIGEYDSTVVQWLDIMKHLEEEEISIQEKMTQLEIEKNEIAAESDSWKRNHQILLTEMDTVQNQLNEELKLREKTTEDCKTRIVEREEEIVSLTERCNVIQKERQDEKGSAIQLEKQMNNLVSELQILKEDYQQLSKEKETVEAELTEGFNLRDKSIQGYEAKVAKLQEEIIKLEEDHAHVQQEIAVKREEIIQMQNENVKATSEFELSKQKFEVSLAEKEVSEHHLREELKLTKKSSEDFEAKIINYEEKIVMLMERCNDIQKERQTEKENVIQLEKQVSEIISELQTSKEDYQRLLIDKEMSEAQLTEGLNLRDKSIEGYETKVVKLTEEIIMLKKDHENAQAELTVKQGEITQLRIEKDKVTSELELSKQKFGELLTAKEVSKQQLKDDLELHEKSIEVFKTKIILCDEEILSLTERCENIQKERQVEKDSLVQMEKQMNEIASELQVSKDDYQQLLKDKEVAEAQLKKELNLRDKSVENYKTKVVEFEEEIIMLKNDRENVQQKIAAKQEEITRLQNEKEEITSELELSHQQRFEKLITEKMVSEQHLKEELKLHEKSIEDFNAKLMERDKAILSLTEKCEDIQKERQVEKDSLVQMEQQMNEIISELQISKEGYQQLLKEKDIMEAQLKTELDFQDKSVESYKTKVVEFEEEIVMLKKDHENLQQEIAAKQEEITRMQNEKVEISSQLELSQQKFEKLLTEKEISEQQLKEELKLHKKSIEDSNAKIMKRDEEILLLKEKCENSQKKSQAGKDSLVEVKKQVNEIISELQVSKEDYQQLLKDKEMAEAQLKTELDHKDNSVESYKTKIVEFEEKIIMLKKDYENVQQEISAKQEEITQLQNGKVKVTAELELFKRNYEKLQEEKEVAEKQLKKALDDRDKIAEDFGAEIAEFNKKYVRLQEHHQELEQRVNRSDETVLQCQTENVAVLSELQLIEENYQQLVTNCEMHKTECDGVCDRLKKVTEDNLANIAQHAEEVLKMKDDHEKILAVEMENVTRLQTEQTKAISELDFFKQNYEKLLIKKETAEKQLKEELHWQKKSAEDSQSVIAELERKIAALNEERECIQKEQDITKETVFQLQNENTKMVSELALLKEHHEKVLMQKQITEKKKLDELHLKQKTIENYELQITELDGKIVILKEELEGMKCERDADKEVGIQLQMEKDKAANELNILNETYKKLLAEKDMCERNLNEELQSQKKSNEDYLAKMTAFDANIATLKAEFEAIQQEGYSENGNRSENEVATELQFLRNTHRQLLMDKETSAKHLNEKLNLQKMLIEDYEYRVAQFDVENEISKKIRENIQQSMDAERERVNQLQTEMAEVTAKLKLSEEKYETILTEKKILEKELNEKLNLQEQSVSDREEIIAELHKKITNLKEEQENLMQGKNTEKEIIMQLQNEKNEVITELELLNQNYQKLLTEAEVTHKELSNKLQLRENAITGHKTKIAEQDKEILMLTREKENIPRVSQESVHNAEFELLNENYHKLLSINEATERRLSAECDYLKKTIDNYVAKLVELQNIKKESPNVQLSINPELQETLQKFSSETEHISNQLCIWAKDRTSLMRKAVDTLKKGEQRNQSFRAELIKTQQGIREIQLTGEGKGDVPLERSEFASPRADTEKEKANWFALRYKKLENSKNEEISNLQTEKKNSLKKLDESLKAAKMSKEKYESEMKKLQKQQDEYKKIAETAMSEIKQMGEKLKSIPRKDDKQLEIVTAKYKKAKEIIEKQNREKKDLGKKLDGATERLKYHENSNAEAIRISNEECQALRKELEETKKSNEPLKMRIKELDKARLIQEQTCKSLERDLKLAHSQLVRLRKTAERCDDQSLRLSLSSSSSSSLKTPLIKKSKKEAIIEEKHVYVRERVTRMVDDSFLMPFNPESNFNHSFASTTSEGLNKSVMGAGNLFQCADEEEYLNHSSLESLNHPCPPSATKRLSELQKRNTLCPPHMRSSYAVEMQMQSPSKFSDEALKEGNAVKVSPKRKRSSSADEAQKSDKESKVVVEKKKKKKTLKPFSTVNSEKFSWSMANRTPTTVRKFMKNIKGFPSSPKPKVDSFWPFKS